MPPLSRGASPRTSATVTSEPFDRATRRRRFQRAATIGDSFLLNRMFDDAAERLEALARPIEHLLVVGPQQPGWRERLTALAPAIDWLDPGNAEEDRATFTPATYDAALAVGSLDSVNQLPLALRALALALRANAPLFGAMLGGHSLPLLRRALIEADRATGSAAARSHPRIDAATLATLLGAAGFSEPVVDIDRITLRYADLSSLVADLRAAAATNMLADRSRIVPGKAWANRLAAAFAAPADSDGRIAETAEIIHFHGWGRG